MSDLDAYDIKLIRKGLRAAEEGKFVSHAEMKMTHAEYSKGAWKK
jgi:predicted transcriptional regulator